MTLKQLSDHINLLREVYGDDIEVWFADDDDRAYYPLEPNMVDYYKDTFDVTWKGGRKSTSQRHASIPSEIGALAAGGDRVFEFIKVP